MFGISERSVGTWWRAYRRDGRDGLTTRRGRPGPAELIGAEDRGTLFAAMADYTPEELLIGGPDCIELHLVPDHSPALNPDELRGADLTRNVNASRAHNVDRLAHETRRFLRRRQRQPHIVRGYFQARHLRYAIIWATEHFRLNSSVNGACSLSQGVP